MTHPALTIADRIFRILDGRRIKDPQLAAVAADGRADILTAEASELWERATKVRAAGYTKQAKRLSRRAQRLGKRAGFWRRRADRLRVIAKGLKGAGL